MKRLRSRLRWVGTASTISAWLLFATHFCVDVGSAHTEVVAHPAHSKAEPHEADRGAHPECVLALSGSADRGPVNPSIGTGGFPEAGPTIVAIAIPAERAAPLASADVGRARSAPLYVLHTAFLI